MADFTVGPPVFESESVVELPLTFTDNVRYLQASAFALVSTRAPDDTLAVDDFSTEGIRSTLRGSDMNYTLSVQIPPDRRGVLSVSGNGQVEIASSGDIESISGMASVNFDTRIPRIKDLNSPRYMPESRLDLVIQFDIPVTFIDPEDRFGSPDATFLDHFLFEGADLGTPNLYRKLNDTFPTFPIPDDLTTEWSDMDIITADATIYLLRYDPVNSSANGVYSVTLKPGSVRGPVTF